ncbi:hypothetical protein BC830DRAFT_1203613 [Chytriomyces sp. MP71]|nr:hypothetical protein BC830DRAFT_1203613 [Chytriomyces sp. MP71]
MTASDGKLSREGKRHGERKLLPLSQCGSIENILFCAIVQTLRENLKDAQKEEPLTDTFAVALILVVKRRFYSLKSGCTAFLSPLAMKHSQAQHDHLNTLNHTLATYTKFTKKKQNELEEARRGLWTGRAPSRDNKKPLMLGKKNWPLVEALNAESATADVQDDKYAEKFDGYKDWLVTCVEQRT